MYDNPLRRLVAAIEAGDCSWGPFLRRLERLDPATRPEPSVARSDVLEYLSDTASLLDVLAVGVESGRADWEGVLRAALGYLGNRDDLVSDDEGVLGVLDDAYLARNLLRSAVASSPSPNVPVHVERLDAEATVRSLLGGPVTATLDVAAEQTVRDLWLDSVGGARSGR